MHINRIKKNVFRIGQHLSNKKRDIHSPYKLFFTREVGSIQVTHLKSTKTNNFLIV